MKLVATLILRLQLVHLKKIVLSNNRFYNKTDTENRRCNAFILKKSFEPQSNRATEQKQRIIQVKIRKSHSPFWLCLLLMQLFDFSVAQLLCGS